MQLSPSLIGVIGLEIHVYVVTKEKLFCTCTASREKGLAPNTHICPTCTAQPGAKPMLPNQAAVEKAVQVACMLGCSVNTYLVWQRKHYSWPDLPKGYQNTLSGPHAVPIGSNGKFFGITIRSMHLEEDPASWNPQSGEIDYNRSGLPLLEIVTAPEFSTAEEVIDWLKKLLHNLEYLKAVDSNAGIKVDVNVSTSKSARVEIKNISSLESIAAAITHELERQVHDPALKQQTRRFDDSKGKTMLMRSKEEAQDYRFIADPDLSPLLLTKEFITHQQQQIPQSPEVKLKNLIKKYNIDQKNAQVLTKHLEIVEFFERVAQKIDPLLALPWITVELLRFLNYNKTSLSQVTIDPAHFVQLLRLVQEGKITPLKAKEILNSFYPVSFMPAASEGKITSAAELQKVIETVINQNPQAVQDYQKGEEKALNFLMGKVMQATNKRADFTLARKILLSRIQQ